jgi:hypothetical protein
MLFGRNVARIRANQSTTMQSFCDLETPQQERLRHGTPESAPSGSWLAQLAQLLGPAPIDRSRDLLTMERPAPLAHPTARRCPSC